MAAEFPQRKEQLVFLINNYDMMLAVIVVSNSASLLSLITVTGCDCEMITQYWQLQIVLIL